MTIERLRLVTWNVNGLRAILQRLQKRGLKELLEELDADIVCFQETKMTRAELDEDLVRPDGFDAFYSFCRVRGGYSGVVTFCRTEKVPVLRAEEGLTGMWKVDDPVGHCGVTHLELPAKVLTELESEGRCVITDHGSFVLLNVYCPALASSDRLEYKLAFHGLLRDRVTSLQQAGKEVIVVGDINVAHREIDHCDPGPCGERAFQDHPCRRWMDSFVISTHGEHEDGDLRLVDSFRSMHPTRTKAFTCWNTVTSARQTNYGTRIDYILVSPGLMSESVTSCEIEPERLGSDHCPVLCSLVVQFDSSQVSQAVGGKVASLCAKYYSEFAGKQQTIKNYFAPPVEVTGSHSHVHDHHVGQSTRKATKGRTTSSSQRTLTSFFKRPLSQSSSSNIVSRNGAAPIEPTLNASAASKCDHPEQLDVEVLESALGVRRRLVENEQNQWKQILSGQRPVTPNCHCGIPTVMRSVLKTNENWGRKFYVCTKPAGEKGHPDARCEFFQWADNKGSNKRLKR